MLMKELIQLSESSHKKQELKGGGNKKVMAYYNDEDNLALCIVPHKGMQIPILIEKDVLDKIRWRSIYLNQNKGMPKVMASVNGVPTYLWRLLYEDDFKEHPDFELDHINGNRFDNTYTNTRAIPGYFNMYNRRDKLPQKEIDGNGNYFFRSDIYINKDNVYQIDNLFHKGYTRFHLTGEPEAGWYTMESPHFYDKKEFGLTARFFNDMRHSVYAYQPEKDFSDKIAEFQNGKIGGGTELLIRWKFLKEITETEAVERNKMRIGNEMYYEIKLINYMK